MNVITDATPPYIRPAATQVCRMAVALSGKNVEIPFSLPRKAWFATLRVVLLIAIAWLVAMRGPLASSR